MGFMASPHDDIAHMRHALRLAERSLGTVAPNPAVGCVIVSPEGCVVGRGWTQPGGRPHAETCALAAAGEDARGATAYVTLEPCAHHGVTPPCADAFVRARIARVVAATLDPDPRVAGAGFAGLESGGVAVTRGVLETQARMLNLGFFKRVTEGRPMVALKIAESADGYVAGADGNSKWITSERARAHGHLLRAKYDAILVGIGTVLADDPALTCRLPGLETFSPQRIVLDSRLRLPPESQLARSASEHPVILFTNSKSGGDALLALGVQIERVPPDSSGRVDVAAVLERLAARGLTRLLVEGGPSVHAGFLERPLVDIFHVYRAPLLIGGGRPAVAPFGPSDVKSAQRLTMVERLTLGPDVLETFVPTV
jgi:diaminohydroxyphosphoribosylaminopyrimidine deaminase/5-amino-6-(5-phosphoribosylamino)uracil reductase